MSDIKMLNSKQATERLMCSMPTLLRRVKAKSIPFLKLGNILMFPKSYFDNLENQAYDNYKRGQNEEVNCD